MKCRESRPERQMMTTRNLLPYFHYPVTRDGFSTKIRITYSFSRGMRNIRPPKVTLPISCEFTSRINLFKIVNTSGDRFVP